MSSEVMKDLDRPSENWPDKELVQTAVREWLKDPEINVIDYRSRMALSKGDNFTSDLYRVTVNCEQTKEPQNIIIKRCITLGSSGEFLANSSLFAREGKVLKTILPKMYAVLKKVIPDMEPFGAQFVYATSGVLMMEDLVPQGFRMADRRFGLDLKHCSLVLRTLAQYHAASIYLMEKKSIDLSLFQKCIVGEPQNKEPMGNFCTGMLRTLSEEVKNFEGLEKYSAKLSALADKNFLSLQVKAMEDHEDDELLALSHGDLWVNNMMFRYSPSGELDGIRFVDYQAVGITSPCNDVYFFLTTSCNESVRNIYMDQLFEEYHEALCRTMSVLGCSRQPPSLDKFKKDCDKRTHYSMFGGFTILPMMMAEPGQFNLNEIVATGKPQKVMFTNESYKKALEWLLPMYESKGYL